MNQPWGLSGPQFLWIYGAGMAAFFAAPWVIALFARILSPASPRVPGLVLDAYEVGYLAGGPRRAAEVVIGELAVSGALRVDSTGRISRADPARLARWSATCRHGISVHDLPDGLRAKKVRRRLVKEPGIAAIGARLRADGLLITRPWTIAAWVTALALWLALMVVGALRLAEGSRNHRPIVDLQDLYMLTVALALYSIVLQASLRTRRAVAGSSYLEGLDGATIRRQVQEQLTAQRAADLAALQVLRKGRRPLRSVGPSAGAVPAADQAALFGIALAGLAAVEDPALRAALLTGLPSSGGGGGGGGGCGGGGGGGCGGGGCGG